MNSSESYRLGIGWHVVAECLVLRTIDDADRTMTSWIEQANVTIKRRIGHVLIRCSPRSLLNQPPK
jgi:hypothetical protein